MQWFGPERYERQMAQAARFWDGEGRCLVSLQTSAHGYRQIFDPALIRQEAPLALRAQAELHGCNLPAFFADFGTVSTARYWGGRLVPPKDGAMIYIHPAAQTVEEALALRPRPVDDPELDAAVGTRLWREVSEALHTDKLWYRTIDMQGPLNTAGLVMNQEEMFMAMYETPDLVAQFVDRVAEFLIELAQYQRTQTQGKVCGNIWPWPFYPAERGVGLTEDLMPLLPPDLYARFAFPALKRMQAALGGLLIHCCGQYGRHVPALVDSGLRIDAIEFHHPATTLEEVLPLALRGTVLIPYCMTDHQEQFKTGLSYWRWLLQNTPKEVRFWFAAGDTPEDRAFAEEFGAQ